MLRLYRRLLELRRSEPALRSPATSGSLEIDALDKDVLVLRRAASLEDAILAVVRLSGSGAVDLGGHRLARLGSGQTWKLLLSTEDAAYAPDAVAVTVDAAIPGMNLTRPAAAILRTTPRKGEA